MCTGSGRSVARREVVVGKVEALEFAEEDDVVRNGGDAVVPQVQHRHVLQTLQMLNTDRLQTVVPQVKLLKYKQLSSSPSDKPRH